MFSVTKNGKPLSENKYTWDNVKKIFSTKENGLVLDFSAYNGVTFTTGYSCVFSAGDLCIFNTGERCVFTTGSDCHFTTGDSCIFNTEHRCTFRTLSYCTFNTGESCIFNTYFHCTFNVYNDCQFKVGGGNCLIIRRDVFEVFHLKYYERIKLKGYNVRGFWTEEELMIKNIIE